MSYWQMTTPSPINSYQPTTNSYQPTAKGASAVWTFPSLEPAIVSGGSFVLDRMLTEAGEVTVRVGEAVNPETVVAKLPSFEKPTTLFVASELGVPNNSLTRYLTKSV